MPNLSAQIGPFKDGDVFCFEIPNNSLNRYQISGRLLDCNGEPLRDGYLKIGAQNLNLIPDTQGNINGTISTCDALTHIEFLALDINDAKESKFNVNISSETINLGDIRICDQFSNESMFFSIDDRDFVYDHIIRATYSNLGSPTLSIFARGFTDTDIISFSLADFAGIGAYVPDTFMISDYTNYSPFIKTQCEGTECSSLSVEITHYTAGQGGIIEGKFEGTIEHEPTPLTIQGLFKCTLE